MTDQYRGTQEPLRQWFEVNWDPSVGYSYDQQYSSHDHARIVALANRYNYYGINTSIRREAGRSVLVTRDTTGNVTIDKWEMAVEREQPSMFENPQFEAVTNNSASPSDVRTLIRAGLDANQTWETTTGTPEFIAAKTGMTSDNFAKLKQYYDDYRRGVTSYTRDKYVLRHTTNAPNRWNSNVADYGVGRIYTISQLLSEVRSSFYWVYPLPGYLAYKILTLDVPSAPSHYTWGALKSASNAVTAANNRVEITTEYLIDNINENLYYLL